MRVLCWCYTAPSVAMQLLYGCYAVAMRLLCDATQLLCGCYAVAMLLLCGCYAAPAVAVAMLLLCGCYAVAKRLPCGCCAVAMRLLCGCYAIAMRLLCGCLFHHLFRIFSFFPLFFAKLKIFLKNYKFKKICWHVQFIENIFLLQCCYGCCAVAMGLLCGCYVVAAMLLLVSSLFPYFFPFFPLFFAKLKIILKEIISSKKIAGMCSSQRTFSCYDV